MDGIFYTRTYFMGPLWGLEEYLGDGWRRWLWEELFKKIEEEWAKDITEILERDAFWKRICDLDGIEIEITVRLKQVHLAEG